MATFKKGMMLGGLLGLGLMWLNTTKKGKAMRDEMLGQAADLYADIKEKVLQSDAWENMTKNKYMAMVEEAVETYAVKNGLADKVKGIITQLLATQWKTLEKEVKKKKKK